MSKLTKIPPVIICLTAGFQIPHTHTPIMHRTLGATVALKTREVPAIHSKNKKFLLPTSWSELYCRWCMYWHYAGMIMYSDLSYNIAPSGE